MQNQNWGGPPGGAPPGAAPGGWDAQQQQPQPGAPAPNWGPQGQQQGAPGWGQQPQGQPPPQQGAPGWGQQPQGQQPPQQGGPDWGQQPQGQPPPPQQGGPDWGQQPQGQPPPQQGAPDWGQPAPQGPPGMAAAYPAPAGPAGPPTVMGIALEPGERVLWFRDYDYKSQKIMLIIFGVLLFVIIIGIILLILGLTIEGRSPKAHVVTNRRFIYITGKGAVQMFPLAYVVDVEPVRQEVHTHGGGLLGAAISVAASAVVNSMANNKAKIDPSYWKRTIAIKLTMGDGAKPQIPIAQPHGAECGILLVRAALGREADYFAPIANYKP